MLSCSEHFMTTWDGSRLFYRAWQPPAPSRKALILFHRGHEHSGRFEDVVNALALDDLSTAQLFTGAASAHERRRSLSFGFFRHGAFGIRVALNVRQEVRSTQQGGVR